MTAIIDLKDLVKSYGKMPAVKGISLSIAEGEFVTILGPSGCGKSTTLRMIGGFELPDSGEIRVGGQEISRLPPNKRSVNMVFQDYALFPHLTVSQNIAFGLEVQGWRRADIKARVQEMLDLVQLGGFADRYPTALSGGQRQRVALARALAPNPPVLLLDEPLGALDAKLRKEMQMELRQLQQRTGKTFILVTHDQEEALEISDTVIVMRGGNVEQQGSPKDLYFRPLNRFVADFVGQMNFLRAEVVKDMSDTTVVIAEGQSVEARKPHPGATATGSGALGIRPEDIRLLAPGEAAPAGLLFEGQVADVVFGGVNLQAKIRYGNELMLVTSRNRSEVVTGETVRMVWPEAACIFYADN